jgi:putative methionine-R-sulfoxide reductase with GAF domain
MDEHQHVVGMLDVESENLNAFQQEDREFLERAAFLLSRVLHPAH